MAPPTLQKPNSTVFYLLLLPYSFILSIENLTKEQYSGNYRRSISALGVSRDSLNPKLSLETLKNRLWVMEHYKYLHGVEHAHWPHFVMQRAGSHLWKYKFNYAVKAFFIYQAVREYQNYRYLSSITFMG